ncbi:hypothetical protein KJ780_04180, partial [Candidatus Micrarchaeota archaeon]|nr:hypothetical protein [Candidatus Micrarchaeota archaeon]
MMTLDLTRNRVHRDPKTGTAILTILKKSNRIDSGKTNLFTHGLSGFAQDRLVPAIQKTKQAPIINSGKILLSVQGIYTGFVVLGAILTGKSIMDKAKDSIFLGDVLKGVLINLPTALIDGGTLDATLMGGVTLWFAYKGTKNQHSEQVIRWRDNHGGFRAHATILQKLGIWGKSLGAAVWESPLWAGMGAFATGVLAKTNLSELGFWLTGGIGAAANQTKQIVSGMAAFLFIGAGIKGIKYLAEMFKKEPVQEPPQICRRNPDPCKDKGACRPRIEVDDDDMVNGVPPDELNGWP